MAPSDRRQTEWKYLCAISALSKRTGLARTRDLSQELGVTPASITGMLKTLSEKGLIDYHPYRGAGLTPKGRREAEDAEERRSVLERFFRLIGLKKKDSERQARQMQSRISDETFLRLKKLVGHMDSLQRDVPDAETVPVRNRPVVQPPASA